jgi:3-oxoacyl-[acyl-carrier protein] reductase
MKRLEGKVALVTGGGTGIGRAIGRIFAEEGASVAVNYSRSEREALEAVREIQELGGKAAAVKADVSKDAEAREMVERTVREFGRLDILVNNAGTTTAVPHDRLEDLTEEIWDRTMAVNVKGTFFCCRAAVPHLRASGRGLILNTASTAGVTGIGSSIAYCASKAGVISLTRSLARSLAPDIRVNALAPGLTDTRWIVGWEENRRLTEAATPLKRVATPEDMAQAALGFAISEFVTGQVLIVDGGRTI